MKSSHSRRHFLGTAATAAMTLAGTQLGIPALAQTATTATTDTPGDTSSANTTTNTTSGSATSLGPIRQIDAGVLNVGYAESGPASGPVVILLHGWPYDIHSYVDVAPILASKGFRVIIPYFRGYGTTTFLSSGTVRTGQQSVFALDIIALMDALKIEKAIVAGFDWGARTANIMAVLWPERCKALVSVSGYLIVNLAANAKPLPPKAELSWWYQYYFATERGRLGYDQNRHDFNKLIWTLASPKWKFDDATYDRSAEAFKNPDHVDIVIHNYRWLWDWQRSGICRQILREIFL